MNGYPKHLPKVLIINRALIRNPQGQYLLIRRSNSQLFDTGKWELPGGKLDIGESTKQNIKREVFEETGLRINTDPHNIAIFEGESEHKENSIYNGFYFIVIVSIANAKSSKVNIDNNEHTDYAWLTKDEILKKRGKTDLTKCAVKHFLN